MTPKEKAIELVNKFLNEQNNSDEISEAKQCALICVDEILEIKSVYHSIELDDHWNEVKQEINNN